MLARHEEHVRLATTLVRVQPHLERSAAHDAGISRLDPTRQQRQQEALQILMLV